MALNEAAVQLMAMKCTHAKFDTVKYFDIELPSNSPDYYTWIKYDTETPDLPPILKTSKFKWVLYANKIRNKRTFN